MVRTRLIHSSLVAVCSLTVAACAASGGGGGAAPSQTAANAVSIRVTNDVVPPASITVWIVPETGGRRRLGTVEPNGQATFSFLPGIRSMEHRLTADKTGGGSATTNPFTLVGITGIRWAASSMVVNVER